MMIGSLSTDVDRWIFNLFDGVANKLIIEKKKKKKVSLKVKI